ncbi:MAG: L-seryl-tRNA(Sec) selenium transferase [bacterium]
MVHDLRQQKLRELPSVDEILQDIEIKYLLDYYTKDIVLNIVREVLNKKREGLSSQTKIDIEKISFNMEHITSEIKKKIEDLSSPSLKRVINGTGIVLHTNIGRALLSKKAIERLIEIAGNYSNLELDIETGKRGERYFHVEEVLHRLTGAEDSLVVNNNAAAVLLILNTLSLNKETIVSRGELVEIGGSFRIPDIITKSGAILKEVGATNKTHLYDYENAINEDTGLILKAHTSNYRIIGFTEEVLLGDLVKLGKKYNIPVVEDLGSGCLVDLKKYGLEKKPTVSELLATGVDLVSFSGDKLLGGPQAGVILGKKKWIDLLKKNALLRALRIDKLTLAALEANLKSYLARDITSEIPILEMLTMPLEKLQIRAEKLEAKLKKICPEGITIAIEDSYAEVGGGAMPTQNIPTKRLSFQSVNFSPNKIEKIFRCNSPPILGRIKEDKFLLDIVTIREEEFPEIVKAVKGVYNRHLSKIIL